MKRISEINKSSIISNRIYAVITNLATLFIILYFIWGQVALEGEITYGLNLYEEITDNWIVTYPDGTRAPIEIPTVSDILADYDTVSISNVLPLDTRYSAISIGNYGQDTYVYIEDRLVFTYTDKNIHKVGVDRPVGNIHFKINDYDAGKPIRIVLVRPEHTTSNRIGPIFIGTDIALVFNPVRNTILEIMIALFMIVVGLGVTLVGHVFKRKLRTDVPIIYLGVGVVLISLWMICNSTGRQYIFPNISITRNCAFLLITLLPIPFAFFFDALQQGRYRKLFQFFVLLCLLAFASEFILNITGVFALSEMYIVPVIICFVMVPIAITTVIWDFKRRQKKDFYHLSAIGSIVFSLCAILQMISYLLHISEKLNAIFMGLGLMVLSIMALIEAIYNFNALYISHENAIKQVETLTTEALETIAKTVDAKDPYTLEHSARVSEYSAMLAQKIGWSDEAVSDLAKSALLHDIGKIGIPDSILNKPAKLTDEEFKVIKSHPSMGAEIITNISSLKFAHDVTLHHHERYDGKGYPDGLAGEDIPIAARIVCIADSFDAMNSKRVYRDTLKIEDIKAELIRCRGTQFDPELLDVFLEIL